LIAVGLPSMTCGCLTMPTVSGTPPASALSWSLTSPSPFVSNTEYGSCAPVVADSSISQPEPPKLHGSFDGISVVKITRPARTTAGPITRSPLDGRSMYQPRFVVQSTVFVETCRTAVGTPRRLIVVVLIVCWTSWLRSVVVTRVPLSRMP
jgi:hypothetical protein